MNSNPVPTPDEWHRLFNAALNQTLTPIDKESLSTLLKSNADARQLWFLYNDNECSLAEIRHVIPAPLLKTSARTRTSSLSLNPLMSAVAGLVIGLFCATVVWGYVGNYSPKPIALLEETFETSAAPLVTGMPLQPGQWSGDFSEIVGPTSNVQPAQGKHMLRFLRADYQGKPIRDGWVADLFHIIDLTNPDLGIHRGDVSLLISAQFSALPQADLQRLSCGVTVYAIDALPPPGERDDAFLSRAALSENPETSESALRILATSARTETTDASPNHWQNVASELRLPASTRYLMIHLRAHLHGSHRPEIPKPVEFKGLFLDNIRTTLTQRPALP
ncbi:hypothetical protein FEM03_11150 [Phragmitibacter flavus]|uniref:Uncharacterized protein n=1 Tax=Phragmitibacter flavus TaxID=2576071 RepID=A0A5R8KFX0_9BACT|nr:hypothetical protein [Phragmitibacter flavus]TLD70855.1 hypothetical protein FEM03_11150 [Phragmitibacter flavus]